MGEFSLRQLRDLSVWVIHQPDADGTALVDHLHRIGCRVEAHWPPPRRLPPGVDVLFVAIERDLHDRIKRLLRGTAEIGPAVIAVVDYENPATLALVLETRSFAVIGKPVRPFGLLANLVTVRSAWLERNNLRRRIETLESKIAGQKKVAKAKAILMEHQELNEVEAYRSIRAQAMAKRTTTEAIAEAIINANDLLQYRPKSD